MDNKEIRTLQILEQIENDKTISQRALAGNLNVSLGLVNSFIKRLVKKGYIKATTIPRNRIAYLLTPKGAAEKTALTYEYIKHSFTFYKSTREMFIQLFLELYENGNRKVAFYGISELTEIAFITIQQTALQLVGIYSDKKDKFLGNTINSISNINKNKFDIIIITDVDLSEEQKEFIEKNFEKSKIKYLR